MATYGWGTNEPIIAPEAEGGENIGTVCVKIKSAITDTFTKLNSETWADASTTASGYMSASDKIKLNGIETGAEVNQFAFSNISVGGTTISADTKQDTLTLTAGTGITLTPDAGNDKVTVGSTCLPLTGGTMTGEITSCGISPATATTFSLGNGTYPYNRLSIKDVYGYDSDQALKYVILTDGPMIRPTTTNTGSIGHSNYKWNAVYAKTFYGGLSGNAASATQLVTARTFRTDLASTSTASFDGTANVTPGVTGILPVANGGTGNSTGAAPMPKTSAGVGQVVAVQGRTVVPAGGTWLYIGFACNLNNSTVKINHVRCEFVAGGSTIAEVESHMSPMGWLYKVA